MGSLYPYQVNDDEELIPDGIDHHIVPKYTESNPVNHAISRQCFCDPDIYNYMDIGIIIVVHKKLVFH
jgi:hypothetical protein